MDKHDKFIAERLKQRRSELGMSVSEVVDQLAALGITVAAKTVFGWENAVSRPNIKIFMALCRIYGVDDILGYFEDKT